MSFSFRWLYCKCKAESTATPNREIKNISSFDSPSPSCTWQRWWISESCNSVQGRHPRPLGTWIPLIIWSTKDWGSSAAVPLPSWSSELHCASVQTPASLQVRHAITKAPESKAQRWQLQVLPSEGYTGFGWDRVNFLHSCIMLCFLFELKMVFSIHPWHPWLLIPTKYKPATEELLQLEHLKGFVCSRDSLVSPCEA